MIDTNKIFKKLLNKIKNKNKIICIVNGKIGKGMSSSCMYYDEATLVNFNNKKRGGEK